VLVEHDIGRIGGEWHVGGDPLGSVVHHRLIGSAEALREMNVEPLLDLLEGEQAALLIERPQELYPTVGGEQLLVASRGATTVGTL
jgi:hypothetical protein